MTQQRTLRDISITLIIIQLAILLAYLWIIIFKDDVVLERYLGYRLPHPQNVEIIILGTTLSLSSVVIYFLLHYFRASHLEQMYVREKLQNEMAQNTIHLLRCHRHDFLNHLQVILGFIQLNKLDKASDYIMNINAEIRGIHITNDIQLPEVAVLLYTKREEALRYNISFSFELTDGLQKPSIKETDLVRILANLIDNAFYELKKLPDTVEKQVEVTCEKLDDHLYIEVYNTGSFIEDSGAIFQYGFTTKGNEGTGIGLFNVQQLVEKYHGKIEVESDPDSGTTFAITI